MASEARSGGGNSAGPLQRIIIPDRMKPRVRALLAAKGVTIDWLLESDEPDEPDASAPATEQTPLNR
jgi:hypothetical protein